MIVPFKSVLDSLPIRYKLLLGYMAVFLLVFAAASAVNYKIIQSTVQRNIEHELDNSTKTITNLVKAAVDASIRNKLRSIAETNLEIVQWAYHQYQTGDMAEQEARDFAQRILLSQKIGNTGYIYVLDSRGVIRIHPNDKLLNADISRHDFIQVQMRDKKGYIEYNWANPGEPAERPKALYMVYFEPWDWIISASSYRDEFVDIVDVSDFRDDILAVRFGETGYPYVIDSKGTLIIHPEREGDNIYEYDFTKRMCKEKNGRIIYPWKNPSDPVARDKLVFYNYIPELDWIVASSGYLEEFQQPAAAIRLAILLTLGLTIILVIPFTWLLSYRIAYPVNRLAMAFKQGSEGNYSTRMEATGQDEIGKLSRYYNVFMERLEWSRSRLEQSEEKYRSIFENAVEGLFQTTADGHFLSANASLAQMLGYDSPERLVNEVSDLHPQLYVDGEDRDRVQEILREKGKVVGFETRLFKRDGSEIDVIVSAREVVGEDPADRHYEGSILDNTERKKREKAERDRRAAESANRAKSEFLANMSHELRTPLNAILGYTQVFRKNSELMERHGKEVDTIHGCGEHLLQMINDILDLSKIEAERLDRDASEFHLPSALESISNMTLPQIRSKGLEYDYGESPGLPDTVVGDEKRLKQVVLNLLSNATKHTSSGKVSFRVELLSIEEREDGEKTARIRCSVEDTGRGIAEEQLEKIFEPFYQVTESQGVSEGTGLGLAISRRLVRLMGGTLDVESRVGEGSRFWFDVSLKIVEGVRRDGAVSGRIKGLRGEGKTILVVDDSRTNLEVLETILSSMGFVVETLDSAEGIAGEIARIGPDLVLLDLRMPGVDGFQALAVIRGSAAIQKTAVIAVSASADEMTRSKVVAYGFDDFLPKPVDHDSLCKVIERHLDVAIEYEPDASTREAALDDGSAVHVPPLEVLDGLLEDLRRQSITAVRTRLDDVARTQGGDSPFVRRLRANLDAYDFKGAITFVDGCKEPTT